MSLTPIEHEQLMRDCTAEPIIVAVDDPAGSKYTATIPAGRIADMIVNAAEGGSNYWCEITGRETLDYSNLVMEGNSTLTVTDHETEEGVIGFILDAAKCAKGVQIMAEKYPQHFHNLVNENDDAETADVFLQCAIFGELIYG